MFKLTKKAVLFFAFILNFFTNTMYSMETSGGNITRKETPDSITLIETNPSEIIYAVYDKKNNNYQVDIKENYQTRSVSVPRYTKTGQIAFEEPALVTKGSYFDTRSYEGQQAENEFERLKQEYNNSLRKE